MASTRSSSCARIAGRRPRRRSSESQASTAEPAPLRICEPSARSRPLIRVCAVNGTTIASAGCLDADAAFRRQRRRPRCPRVWGRRARTSAAARASSAVGDAGHRHEVARLPVAVGDRAGLVEQQRRDVAGGLDRAARHREHVALHEPVHAGDADRREQRADRGRDEADEQGDEHRDARRRRRVGRRSG